MEIKVKSFADVIGEQLAKKEVQKVTEADEVNDNSENEEDVDEVSWNHMEVAAQDCFNDLKSDGWEVKKGASNSVKIKHDNGAVGVLVFDPQNKY